MVPTRGMFWNIPHGEILYLIGAIVIGIFIYVIYRRYKFWRLGKPDNRFNHLGRRIWVFIVTVIVDGLLHRTFFSVAEGLGRRPLSVKEPLPKETMVINPTATFLGFLDAYADLR